MSDTVTDAAQSIMFWSVLTFSREREDQHAGLRAVERLIEGIRDEQ